MQPNLDIKINQVATEATQFVEKNLVNIEAIAKDCSKELGIDANNLESTILGKPFIIYNADSSFQNETFYYPLINNKTKDVFLIVGIMGTTVGWQYSLNTDLVKELNELRGSDNNYIFYQSEEVLIAQTKEKKHKFKNKKILNNFDDKTFEEKRKIITNKLDKLKKVDVVKDISQSELILEKYTPTITNELGYYHCNINGAQGQGAGTALCWAASVATIANYINGTNHTAKKVANDMKIGYDNGANDDKKQQALALYNVNYSRKLNQLTFDQIMLDIKNKRPIAVNGQNALYEIGHAVTIYGYRNLEAGKFVIIWDSALNSGLGGVTITTYNSNGTTFVSGTATYTWVSSLSKSYK